LVFLSSNNNSKQTPMVTASLNARGTTTTQVGRWQMILPFCDKSKNLFPLTPWGRVLFWVYSDSLASQEILCLAFQGIQMFTAVSTEASHCFLSSAHSPTFFASIPLAPCV
jgi:hypothetical protein